MKVALCQINTTIGDFDGNRKKMKDALEKAAGASIAVFPELSLSSYPPLDLLDRTDFLEANEKSLNQWEIELNALSNDAPELIVFGSILKSEKKFGRNLLNAAFVYQRKSSKYELIHTQAKRLLPTYDVFDESRYFDSADQSKILSTKWGKIGITICEDAWFEHKPGKTRYQNDPALDLKGADLIINLSASPFEMNKRKLRREMLFSFVEKTNAPLVYVNQVGANDEILFDGSSVVLSAKKEILCELPAFEESVTIWDSEKPATANQTSLQNPEDEMLLLHKGLVTGIRDYFSKTGFKKAVIGLSGGIDSAVVATLAAEALGPQNVLGVSMPSQFSSGHSMADAAELAKNLGIQYATHSIKFVNSTLLMELKPSFEGKAADVTEENIQARLRAIILLALANKKQALVLTTGNKSELAVGYCTSYGDMAGAIAPLGDVYKTKVFELARHLNRNRVLIPVSTLTKPPSAELRKDQKDEDSLGSYDQLDVLLQAHIEGQCDEAKLVEKKFEPAYVRKILSLVRISEFKRRQAAPSLKVTSKAFGLGRRMPIVRKF